MKKSKVILFILIFVIIVSFISVCAQNDKPLYEKYGFKEDYIYNGEMAAHALKVTTAYVEAEAKINVTYTSLKFDKSAIKDYKEEIRNKFEFSDEELNEYVIDYVISNYEDFSSETKNKTSDSMSGHGSGVVISEDGYVATNSHVVNCLSSEEESMLANNIYCSQIYNSDIDDIEDIFEDIGLELKEENKDKLFSVLENIANENNKYNCEYSYCVIFPSADGKTSVKKASIYEATLIEDGTPVSQSDIGLTEDAAILKVNKKNMVALKLSEKYPEVNSDIITAGFPAVAEEIFESAGSDESVLSVSVGSGNIARIVPIEGRKYKALEITTTISNGNSGGPSVDNKLDIEGLNTYGSISDMRFAYMIPAEFVRDLTQNIDLKRDEATKTFLTGLQMLDQNYGGAALECFERVRELRKDTPYIKNLIELSKDAPQEFPEGTQEDKKIEKKAEENNKKSGKILLIAICCVLTFVIISVIVVVIVVFSKKKKEKNEISYDEFDGIDFVNEETNKTHVEIHTQSDTETLSEKKSVLKVRMGEYEPSPINPTDASKKEDDNKFFERGQDL